VPDAEKVLPVLVCRVVEAGEFGGEVIVFLEDY